MKWFGSPDSTEEMLHDFTNKLVVVGMTGIVEPPRADIPEVVNIAEIVESEFSWHNISS